jgi:hypothetical protein
MSNLQHYQAKSRKAAMVHGFAKNLLARLQAGMVGFDNAVGEEELSRLTA